MKNKYDLELERLRKNIDKEKYYKLKEQNKGDLVYGWAFKDGDVLYETYESIIYFYDDEYAKKVVNVYIEILEKCQK